MEAISFLILLILLVVTVICILTSLLIVSRTQEKSCKPPQDEIREIVEEAKIEMRNTRQEFLSNVFRILNQ